MNQNRPYTPPDTRWALTQSPGRRHIPNPRPDWWRLHQDEPWQRGDWRTLCGNVIVERITPGEGRIEQFPICKRCAAIQAQGGRR